jgi:hypothetical protein
LPRGPRSVRVPGPTDRRRAVHVEENRPAWWSPVCGELPPCRVGVTTAAWREQVAEALLAAPAPSSAADQARFPGYLSTCRRMWVRRRSGERECCRTVEIGQGFPVPLGTEVPYLMNGATAQVLGISGLYIRFGRI